MKCICAAAIVLLSATALLVAPAARLAASGDSCTKAKSAPETLYGEVAKNAKVREMHRSDIYVGLEDANDGTLWTFTLPKHPAHPAVVCRRIVERRGLIDIPTVIQCDGATAACAQLKRDFEALNDRMIRDLYKQHK